MALTHSVVTLNNSSGTILVSDGTNWVIMEAN